MTLNLGTRRVRCLALVLALCGVVGVVAAGAQMTGPPSEEKRSPKPQSSATNPVSGQPEAIDAGRKLYVIWCVQCHGPKADGVSRFGKYAADLPNRDRKSTRLNSSHVRISYAVFCLKKKKK